ncbi:hypothetical protein PCASD_09121 [Puccinia coronata f. sp. avenae]|uniref:Uncharacterized protein n=1 Tax=Puccinia coronata f. sp. avenae TaxID=200324 RepID=A0A2N5V4M7_9BASI|nr:hypothetical protein PCASD_09121 [Puccinia coronata f. sp. avenae]
MAVHTAATNISAAAGAGAATNGSNKSSLRKEDRCNSTGGLLPTGSQISLLLMNKDALFNTPSSFGGKLEDPDHPPVGFQFNRQSIPVPPATNGDDKPLSTPATATTTTTNGGNMKVYYLKRNSNPFWSKLFKFLEIGLFKIPLILNVYQMKKVLNPTSSKSSHSNLNYLHSNSANSSSTTPSQITLIGQIHLDFKAFEKNGPGSGSPSTPNYITLLTTRLDTRDMNGQRKVDIIGELNLSINGLAFLREYFLVEIHVVCTYDVVVVVIENSVVLVELIETNKYPLPSGWADFVLSNFFAVVNIRQASKGS